MEFFTLRIFLFILEEVIMSNHVNVTFSYPNTNKGLTKIWTTLPLDNQNTIASHPYEKKYTDDGQNEIYYIVLQENEPLTITYSVNLEEQQKQLSLSDSERAFYLRSGTLVVVDQEMKDLAMQITSNAQSVREKAEAIFTYLVNEYKYVYPPKGRGVKTFLQTKQGDCGEYSFLFTSLCRSLDIPCRTIVGSWANGKMNAHVWNEFFEENVGWVPVDCSLAYMQKKKKFQFLFSNNRTFKWTYYFGQHEGQRVVFSHDAELYLSDFHDIDKETLQNAAQPPIAPFQVDWISFYWGYESLNGHAPYIQPIYPRFEDENLTVSAKKDTTKYLGTWKVTETGLPRFFYLIKYISYFVFLIFIALTFILDSPLFGTISSIAIILVFVSYIARKERTLLFTIFSIYFLLVLTAYVTKLMS